MERLRTRRHFNQHAQRSSLPLMCLLCTLVTLAVLITDQQHGGRTIITSSTTSSDVKVTTSVPALDHPMKRGSTAITDEGLKHGRRSLLPHTPPHWSRWSEFLIPSSHSDPKPHREEDDEEDEEVCIGWRQTANCDPDGLEEPFYSQSCDAVIYKGAPSGFCLCAGGVRTHPLRCEGVGAPFTCREKCAALTANRLEMGHGEMEHGAAREGSSNSKSSYYRRLEEAVWNAKDEAEWGKAVAALRAQRYRDNAARDHKCQQAWRGWERGFEPQRATQLLFVDRDGTGKPSLFLEAWPCDRPLVGAVGEGPLPPTATTTTIAPTERSATALVCICGDGSAEGTDITIRENGDGSRSVTCDEHCRSTFTALHPPRLFDLRGDDEEREIEMEERSERRSTPTGGRALERAVLSDIDVIKRERLFVSEEEKSRSHPRRGPMVVKLERDRHWQRLRDAELEHVLGPMSQRHRT